MKSRVIANFTPSVLEEKVIQQEFKELVEKLGFRLDRRRGDEIDLRSPEASIKVHAWSGKGKEWHQDGSYFEQEYVIVWTNKTPTEVRYRNNRRLKAKDGDVILLQNKAVLHRCPPGAEVDKERWFARAWILPPEEE